MNTALEQILNKYVRLAGEGAETRLEVVRARAALNPDFIAEYVTNNVSMIPTEALCRELRGRLDISEPGADETATTLLGDLVTPTSDQTAEHVKAAELTPEDIWPGVYIRNEDTTDAMGPLIRAVAAVVYDFDLEAVRELQTMLLRMDVHNRFAIAAEHAQPALLLGFMPVSGSLAR